MSYRELMPPPALRAYVERFWVRSGAAEGEAVRVLPDGCIDILVEPGGGGCLVVGAMTRSLVVAPRPDARTVAVRFRPGGATPFFRAPAHELTDRIVDSSDLGLRWTGGGWLDGSNLDEVARGLAGALLGQLSQVRAPHAALGHATRVLLGAAPPTVAALARDLGWSRQHLGQAFREHVGIAPKQLARVARLQRAVSFAQHDTSVPLAQVAADAGYFDEAHMDRDFRDLAGVTPGVARANPVSIRPIRSLFDRSESRE